MLDLSTTHKVRLVPVSMADMKKISKIHPYWSPSMVKAGTYPNIKIDVNAMASKTIVITHKDTDPKLVYKVTKAIFEHTKELGEMHRAGKKYALPGSSKGIPIPVHPGAARYYKEKGIKF